MSRKAHALASTSSDETSVTAIAADWEALFGCPAPRRMERIIEQAVAWKRQVLQHGDVAPAVARDLALVCREVEAQRTASSRLSPDTSPPALPVHPEALPPEPVSADPVRNGASRDDCPTGSRPSSTQARSRANRSRDTAPSRRSIPAAPLPPASSQLLVGTRLVKEHGGETHIVEVTADGMLYTGELFSSLSAVAKRITGTHWNGLLFFGLRRRKTYPAKGTGRG